MKYKENGQWKSLGEIDFSGLGKYTLLTTEMVEGTLGHWSQKYIGTETHLIIDDNFPTDNLESLFSNNQTLESLVILTDKFISMRSLFYNIGSQFKSLLINTSNLTSMYWLFRDSQATSLDLTSFDTSNVTNMTSTFYGSQATTLDLSSFDTSNVTNMNDMFYSSKATSLDLSSFDTSNVTDMSNMFRSSPATTGYARTQADADKFNASSGKPSGLTFVVKPE